MIDIFKAGKKLLVMALLLFTEKIWAADPKIMSTPGAVAYGPMRTVPQDTSFADVVNRLAVPVFAVSLLLIGGIVSPIIGFRWYIKHGGTKKWIGYLAYAPLCMAIAWISAIVMSIINDMLLAIN